MIWTRHGRSPDLTTAIRSRFVEAGLEEVAFDIEEGAAFGAGTNRLVGSFRPFQLDHRAFTFAGNGSDAQF